jgi:hypothetical protein
LGRWRWLAGGIATVALVTACGGFPAIGNPVGEPLLPDLVPEPPVDLRIKPDGDRFDIRFSSTLVNVGEGDFVLRANRDSEEWQVEQEIWYSESGGELRATDAEMVWGGDGHHHWHIKRVANYRLVALDEDGKPIEEDLGFDTKIGFCFYDSSHEMSFGAEEAVYELESCGLEDDLEIRMGMSIGWADIYGFDLPGQSIDITDLPDGSYRLWAEADIAEWFVEETRDNNVTWIDFEIVSRDDLRFAQLTDVGPTADD